jgi:nicotinamidase-related amidase
MNQLPLPAFYDKSKAGEIWKVPYKERFPQALDWRKQFGVRPSASDKYRIAMLNIDIQPTFCFPDFELPVIGAVDDCVRTAEFIYHNLPLITRIWNTLDTHRAMQIFHPMYLIDQDGNHPSTEYPTQIEESDVLAGKWRVNPGVAAWVKDGDYTWLQAQFVDYVQKLAKKGRYTLTCWPFHAMMGGIGWCNVPIVDEAVRFHEFVRSVQNDFEIKGGHPCLENYSIFATEVLDGPGGVALAQKNARLLKILLEHDIVIIAGQAKSHCVAWTIDDLLGEINTQDPDLTRKVYLLEDCTSPVVVPGVIDFTKDGNEAFDRFAKAGMNIVKSTTPIDQWPGVIL